MCVFSSCLGNSGIFLLGFQIMSYVNVYLELNPFYWWALCYCLLAWMQLSPNLQMKPPKEYNCFGTEGKVFKPVLETGLSFHINFNFCRPIILDEFLDFNSKMCSIFLDPRKQRFILHCAFLWPFTLRCAFEKSLIVDDLPEMDRRQTPAFFRVLLGWMLCFKLSLLIFNTCIWYAFV